VDPTDPGDPGDLNYPKADVEEKKAIPVVNIILIVVGGVIVLAMTIIVIICVVMAFRRRSKLKTQMSRFVYYVSLLLAFFMKD
jgi:hypothetical protein